MVNSHIGCFAIAKFENWHYSAYDSTTKNCYLLNLETDNPINTGPGLQIPPTFAEWIWVNIEETIPVQQSHFKQILSDSYAPYIFRSYSNLPPTISCSFICMTYPSDYPGYPDYCDFHLTINDSCYLGHFATNYSMNLTISEQALVFVYKCECFK